MEPLIELPENEALTKLFRCGLAAEELVWPTSIEAGSLELVAPYVAAGFGVALSVLLPGGRAPARTRPCADSQNWWWRRCGPGNYRQLRNHFWNQLGQKHTRCAMHNACCCWFFFNTGIEQTLSLR
jgi:hypothetical protein